MPYVKAQVDDETHKAIRMTAAERGVRVEDVAAEWLEEHTDD